MYEISFYNLVYPPLYNGRILLAWDSISFHIFALHDVF